VAPHLDVGLCSKTKFESAERIDEENDFAAPNPWLRRLGSAVHLKDFSGKKDFLRGLISMEYEVDPDDPHKSDDA
jgi:hypothetical protein